MHPTITLGHIVVRAYPVCVTLGVLVSWALLLRRTAVLGYASAGVLQWVMLAFPVGALGSIAFACTVAALTGRVDAVETPENLVGGAASGASVLGAVFACFVFSVAYIRWRWNEAPWPLLDAVAFTYPLALAFGRWGCLLEGCCFGAPTPHGLDMPVLTLPLSGYAPGTTAARHLSGMPADTHLWNLPLLFAVNAFAALVIVEAVYRRWGRAHPGLACGTVLAVESFGRVGIEWFRYSEGPVWIFHNPWQATALSIGFVATGLTVRAALPAKDIARTEARA